MRRLKRVLSIFFIILFAFASAPGQQLQKLDNTDSDRTRREKTNSNFQTLWDKIANNFSILSGKESPLTFSSPLSRSTNTITCPTCLDINTNQTLTHKTLDLPILQGYPRSSIPTGSMGNLFFLNNDVGGVWLKGRAGKSYSISAEEVNVEEFGSINAAIDELNGLVGPIYRTLVIPNQQSLPADLVIPDYVTLKFGGSGVINHGSHSLTVYSSSRGWPLRQIIKGSGAVKLWGPNPETYPQWFGGKIDGTDDGSRDTPAIQKAINSLKGATSSPHPGVVLITGGAIINTTLTMTEASTTIRGTGWGVSNSAPYSGSIRWNGSAGIPMIEVYIAYGAGVEYLRLIGKSSAKPSAAIKLNVSTGTNHNFFQHLWIGGMYGYDSDDAVQFTTGILCAGSLDGDSNSFRDVTIYKATTGIDIQNANASMNQFDRMYIYGCGVGFKTVAPAQAGTNWTMLGNTVDIVLSSTPAALSIHNYASEGAGRLATLADLTQLKIDGGGFQAGANLNTDGFWILNNSASSASVTLEDFQLYDAGGYPGDAPKIKMRGSGHKFLTLRNTRSIQESGIDMGLTAGVDEDGRRIIIYEHDTVLTESGDKQRIGVNILTFGHQTIDFSRNDLQSSSVLGNLGINTIASLYGLHQLGGGQRLEALATTTPVAASATEGTAGSTSYSYYLVAKDKNGNRSLVSTVHTITTGNATLNSTNRVLLSIDPQPGVYSIDVLKINTSTLLETVDTSRGYRVFVRDTGQATSSYTPPTRNETADVRFDGGKIVLGSDVTAFANGTNEFWIVNAAVNLFKPIQAGSYVANGDVYPASNAGYDLGAITNRWKRLWLDATITASGTTGAQTINKAVGAVNFPAGASSLVVTNSMVSASSIVIATIQTDDTTATSVKVIPASGSFTLKLNANATAETRVGFIVIN